MSQFTEMEQAERWVNRLESKACDLIDEGDYAQADELRDQARILNQVISKVQYGCADPSDMKIYKAAVAARTLRDMMIAS
ncbi:hypothetical protein [Bacillus sp. FSL K6-6540]|uniref:hypothetical protein n=1 Tax=Bacillus sp. FSL K6-6540 TaxID=2921512 RepID=UPI0030F9F983